MKVKFLTSTLAVVCAAGLVMAQPGQPWEDATGATRLFEFDNTDITTMDGLVFQLVVDPGGNTDFGAMVAAGSSGAGWGIGGETHMFSGSTADYNADDDVVISPFHAWVGVAEWDAGYLPGTQTAVSDNGTDYWNTQFYFRWFNSDDIATATEAGIIYNDSWVTPPNELTPADVATLTYGRPGNDGSELAGDGWQTMPMVPEPGSFALFGLGLLTVAARRKLRKRA